MLATMSALLALSTHPILAVVPVGPEHPGINPPLNGAIALGALLLLLFVTTRLNRDK